MSYQLLGDELLLKLIRTSDHGAFNEIYERYWRKVFFLVFKKTKSKEAAKEITQNLFISIWENREDSKIENIDSYLSVAVKYKVINYVEAALVRKHYYDSSIKVSTDFDSAENKLLLNELNNAIQNAIHILPPKTRKIFKLSRFENYTIKEIATIMNLSEKAVEYHITQSLKFLRVELKEFLAFDLCLIYLLAGLYEAPITHFALF